MTALLSPASLRRWRRSAGLLPSLALRFRHGRHDAPVGHGPRPEGIRQLGAEVLVGGGLVFLASAFAFWRRRGWLATVPWRWRISRVGLSIGGTVLPTVAGVVLLTLLMHLARGIGRLHAMYAKALLVAPAASAAQA